MNGILLVDKPEGLTSAEVVRRVKRQARVKVGHLGTLDPFATGVLPLCLGEATKIAQFLSAADKDYEGVIRLGAATDTADRTGNVVRTAPVPPLDDGQLRVIAERFVGPYEQVPPMYSALKRDGVPLYKLARQGIEVDRTSRMVQLTALRLVAAGPDTIAFAVSCSKGTYVRVLAEDIGAALGSVAHVQALRRTRFGPFDLAQAVELDRWSPGDKERLVPIRAALAEYPEFLLQARAVGGARRGQAWVLRELPRPPRGDLAVLVGPDGAVVAVVNWREDRWVFARVLHEEHEALQGGTAMLNSADK